MRTILAGASAMMLALGGVLAPAAVAAPCTNAQGSWCKVEISQNPDRYEVCFFASVGAGNGGPITVSLTKAGSKRGKQGQARGSARGTQGRSKGTPAVKFLNATNLKLQVEVRGSNPCGPNTVQSGPVSGIPNCTGGDASSANGGCG